MDTLEQIIRGNDERYSAFGIVLGRAFIADADTLEEVQTYRQDLKREIEFNHAPIYVRDQAI